MTIDLESLKRTLLKRGQEEESVWPCVLLTIFSRKPTTELGPHAAKLVRQYMDLCNQNRAGAAQSTLITAHIRDDIGRLSKRRIARDLEQLEAPKNNTESAGMLYSSSETAQPGSYGVTVDLIDTIDEYEHSSVIQLEFPWQSVEGASELFLSDLVELLNDFPFSVATAGFGFSLWQADRFAKDQLFAMLPRYSGFDLTDIRYHYWIRDATPSPSWLTFLNTDLMESLGGASALAEHAPEAQIVDLPQGVCIRASKYPPVGDVNHQALDIGALPGVARFLKPKRIFIPATAMRGREGRELDIKAWLARFDDRDNLSWENR